VPIINISPDDLSSVTGGADLGAPSGEAIDGALASPSSKMTGVVNPGGQVWENNHSGPSALERGNAAFDRSTRVMRTFNEIGGAFTQAPGFGKGDVLKPSVAQLRYNRADADVRGQARGFRR
jgi:hypothetical protein